jgi:membrane-associated phospholipid phosphatase
MDTPKPRLAMPCLKRNLLLILVMVNLSCQAQLDTSQTYTAYIIPTALITYGTMATYTSWGNDINKEIRLKLHTPGQHTKIDDYLVLSPAAAVYGLNVLGVQGKNNFLDRSVVLSTSFLIAYPLVFSTKELTHVLRPDGSTYNSFPSGHTAYAFACAEFMRVEYQDRSIWYGVAGYAAATTVAGLRIYNNRHWFSDVAAGAGVGILSTTLAYRVQPWISDKVFKQGNHAIITPQINQNYTGVNFSLMF